MSLQFTGVAELMKTIRDISEEAFKEDVQLSGEIRNAREGYGKLYLEVVETVKSFYGNSFNYQISCQIENATNVLENLGIHQPSEMEGQEYMVRGFLRFRVTQNRYVIELIEILPSGKGAIEQRRKHILGKLEKEGLFPVEQIESLIELENPPLKLAIIGSPNTRGISDLFHNIYRSAVLPEFKFYTVSVESTASAEQITEAIKKANEIDYDLIVIVRGGGGQGGLLYLEDEKLARAVISSKIPVLVGIGHTEDKSLLDLVATISKETPTAAGSEIANTINHFVDSTEELIDKVKETYSELFSEKSGNLQRALSDVLDYGIDRYVSDYYKQLDYFKRRFLSFSRRLETEKNIIQKEERNLFVNINELFYGIRNDYRMSSKTARNMSFKLDNEISRPYEFLQVRPFDFDRLIIERHKSFQNIINKLENNFDRIINDTQRKLTSSKSTAVLLNPFNVIKGMAIVSDINNNRIESIAEINKGDNIEVVLKDGSLLSEVKEKHKKNKN
ncbi:MAG: exodeoxyribonuclease VII large subunit [Thermotogota bacterium]|nr:exodeoxyribonuclease VII large subunit [Thermotogota bacterium]